MSTNDELAAIDKRIVEAETNFIKTKTQASDQNQAVNWWTTTNAMTMCSVVLVFGLLVTIIAATLLFKGKSHGAVLRVFGTILILVLSAFLVIAGYDDRQIAPVLGLLGTVAGYLLGSREGNSRLPAPNTQGTGDFGDQKKD